MGLLGSLLEAIVKGTIERAGEAARTQRDAENLSNKDLADAFKNSTGAARDGYRAEIARRTGK